MARLMPEPAFEMHSQTSPEGLALRPTVAVLGAEGARQIVDAVQAAPDARVVHLDLKDVALMTSPAIGAVIVLHKALQRDGRALELL